MIALPAAAPVFAQQPDRQQPSPAEQVFQQIDNAYKNGALTLDSALREKFRVVFEPEKASRTFMPENGVQARCLTSLFSEFEKKKDRLSPEVARELNAYRQANCSRPETEFSHVSQSGNFRIHYDTSGPHAVPSESRPGSNVPVFVERTAFAADSSWKHLTDRLGFADPLITSVLEPYNIHYRDFSFYGVTCSDGLSSFMVLNNNFEGFPENDHPEGNRRGALYVTTAHEYKHASQYATNRWDGPPEEDTEAWIEMDAVMIEDIIFPDVNDYFHYIKTALRSDIPDLLSIFGNPEIPPPVAYSHATWMLYFAEKYGMPFWVDVWDRFRLQPAKAFTEAIRESLYQYDDESGDTAFEQNHIENLAWHLSSGPVLSGFDFGFIKRDDYPHARFNLNVTTLPDSTASDETLRPLGGHFIQVSPAAGTFGNPRITVRHEREGIGVGIIGYFHDGSVEYTQVTGRDRLTEIQTDWLWEDLEKMGVVVVNVDEESTNSYSFRIESVSPEEIALFQNYPNPFTSSTHIRFAVDTEQRVRLEIYDILGRRVAGLADRQYARGFHDVSFEAEGLASGVYIYRLTAGRRVLSKKMMFIK
ncbi:MAG: T9SS type A sorting domain-containing protein [Balneolaceae bacterium]